MNQTSWAGIKAFNSNEETLDIQGRCDWMAQTNAGNPGMPYSRGCQ
jgi:hypothetical protein